MKCKIIISKDPYSDEEGMSLTLDLGFSDSSSDPLEYTNNISVQSIVRLLFKDLFQELKKDLITFLRNGKLPEIKSVRIQNLNLFKNVVGNSSINDLKLIDEGFNNITIGNTSKYDILIAKGGLKKSSISGSIIKVLLDEQNMPIYILNGSKKFFNLAKARLREHLLLKLEIFKASQETIDQLITNEEFASIVEAIKGFNEKILLKIKSVEEEKAKKLKDGTKEDSEEISKLNKKLTKLRLSFIPVVINGFELNKKQLIYYYKLLSQYEDIIPSAIKQKIDIWMLDEVQLEPIEYDDDELNSIQKSWDSNIVEIRKSVKGELKSKKVILRKLSIEEYFRIIEHQKIDIPAKPITVIKPNSKRYVTKKYPKGEDNPTYKKALEKYNKYKLDKEEWKKLKKEATKSFLEKLKMDPNFNEEKLILDLRTKVLAKMYYHGYANAKIEIKDDEFIITPQFGNLFDRYSDLFYQKDLVVKLPIQSTTDKYYRGFPIYYYSVDGTNLYFYDSYGNAVTRETLTIAKDNIEAIKDAIDSRLDYSSIAEYSKLYAYTEGVRTDLHLRILSPFLYMEEGAILELYDLDIDDVKSVWNKMSNSDQNALLAMKIEDAFNYFSKKVPKELLDMTRLTNSDGDRKVDPEKFTVLILKLAAEGAFNSDLISEEILSKVRDWFENLDSKRKMYSIEIIGAIRNKHKPNEARLYYLKPIQNILPYKFERPQSTIDNIQKILNLLEKLGIKTRLLQPGEILYDNEGESYVEIDGNNVYINSNAKAFIYNGTVYVNGGLATSHDVLHEYSHLLIEYIKVTNYELYKSLEEAALKNTTFSKNLMDKSLVKGYRNRSMEDIIEEVLADHLATYILNRYDPNTIFHELKDAEFKKFADLENMFNDMYTAFKYMLQGLFDSEEGTWIKWNPEISEKITRRRLISNYIESKLIRIELNMKLTEDLKKEKIIEDCK